MDEQQRQRISTIQEAMTKITIRRSDLSGFWRPEGAVEEKLPPPATDEEFQARMLALLPGLVVVVRGLWDMHNQALPHTQVSQSPVPPGLLDDDEQRGAATTVESLAKLAATVELLWGQHLGEWAHLAHPPVDRGKPEP